MKSNLPISGLVFSDRSSTDVRMYQLGGERFPTLHDMLNWTSAVVRKCSLFQNSCSGNRMYPSKIGYLYCIMSENIHYAKRIRKGKRDSKSVLPRQPVCLLTSEMPWVQHHCPKNSVPTPAQRTSRSSCSSKRNSFRHVLPSCGQEYQDESYYMNLGMPAAPVEEHHS
jgi:hypothetical protein